MIKSVFFVLIASLALLKVNAQDDNLDISVWYIMKVAKPDKDALQHHIQIIYVPEVIALPPGMIE